MSWGVVDRSRRDGRNDELIGFVTARIVPAKDSEVSLGVIFISDIFSHMNFRGGLLFGEHMDFRLLKGN